MQWTFSDLIQLRQKPDQEYQIEEEELIEYAEHLGIELPQEMYLLDIAKEGYTAKLPPQWIPCKAPDDNIMYYNESTHEIIEDHPMDQFYRGKVIQARLQHSNRSERSSSRDQALDELSEIIEDEQEIANDSEIYERKGSGYRMQDLRKPVSQDDFSYLRDTRHKNIPKQAEVSALQRNISMEDSQNTSKNDINSIKILPSSLLDNYKGSQQFSLNQYQTRYSQKIQSQQENKKHSNYSQSHQSKQEKKESNQRIEMQLLKQLKQQLQEIEKQEKLKENILKNLEKDNNRLLEKIRRKINRQKAQRKTKNI